jgi:hypothetical protein
VNKGRYRWRTSARRLLPWWIADHIPKGSRDCGDHEFYNEDYVVEHCYHCTVGERPFSWTHF